MRILLDWAAAAVTRRPVAVIIVLALATIGLAAAAATNEFEVDMTKLGRADAAPVQALDRVRAEFGDPAAMVQVILDAGPDGDVLTASGMAAATTAGETAVDALGSQVRTDPTGAPQLMSLAVALPGDVVEVGPAAAELVATSPQLATLVSDDIDLAAGTARATVVAVFLDEDLSKADRTDAAQRVRDAFTGDLPPELAGLQVTVYSLDLFEVGMMDAVRAEAPRLFGLALLVVLVVLVVLYRSGFDVAIGFAGLLATVAWTLGFAALLGPPGLGWLGPLSQLVLVVPVLLVGLGIDYSVHLTARYREQRAAGQQPAAAASRALGTVGAALTLATVATAVGFATTAAAPLPLLADFGVTVAIGVVCAFVIMALLVPSARVLRDRRTGARPRAVRELRLGGLLAGPAALARRYPAAGLVVAAVLVGGSLAAATALDTRFDRGDFIPEGSDLAEVLDHQAELFGAGVTETTFVVVDGDLADPALAAATDRSVASLGQVDGIRSLGGTPQAVLRPAPDQAAALVTVRTTAGDAGAGRLQQEVRAAFAPVREAGGSVMVTSEPLIIAEMNEELGRFQVRAVLLTLSVVLVLLVSYYWLAHRRPLLGVMAMVPAITGACLIFGAMWLLGMDFNMLTATLTAIAVGIGVPYGVHVVNRFVEDFSDASDASAAGSTVAPAVTRTLHATGAALTGSAVTTLGALVVLSTSGLPPIRSLGLLGGSGIAFALLAAVLVVPGALVLWARRTPRRARR